MHVGPGAVDRVLALRIPPSGPRGTPHHPAIGDLPHLLPERSAPLIIGAEVLSAAGKHNFRLVGDRRRDGMQVGRPGRGMSPGLLMAS
jgi:hypothetical protein